MEEWRPVRGFEERYDVSSLGRIRSKVRGKGGIRPGTKHCLMKGGLTPTGYRTISLCGGATVRRHTYFHRLVAEAFLPNPSNLPVINHKNAIKNDNRAKNLEWCDYSHNFLHAISLGIHPDQKGSGNYMSKLTEAEVRLMRRLYKTGKMKPSELAQRFKVKNVYPILQRATWKHI